MILETDRLILRKMTQDDYTSLCSILQDADVMYAYAHAFSASEVQDWLDRGTADIGALHNIQGCQRLIGADLRTADTDLGCINIRIDDALAAGQDIYIACDLHTAAASRSAPMHT